MEHFLSLYDIRKSLYLYAQKGKIEYNNLGVANNSLSEVYLD